MRWVDAGGMEGGGSPARRRERWKEGGKSGKEVGLSLKIWDAEENHREILTGKTGNLFSSGGSRKASKMSVLAYQRDDVRWALRTLGAAAAAAASAMQLCFCRRAR